LGLTHIGTRVNCWSGRPCSPAGTCEAPRLRTKKHLEPLRDERLHEETPHRRTDSSDQTGCRLTDEPTTPPYQRRPGTASGTPQRCGRQPQRCLKNWCVRSHPTDGAPRLGLRRVRRLPAPAYRLLFRSRRLKPPLPAAPTSRSLIGARLSVIG